MKDIRNLFRTEKGTKAIKDMKIKKNEKRKHGNMENSINNSKWLYFFHR